MRVAFFTADSNGGYPVPATNGGAVSTLIESLANENNIQNLCDMTIVSLYDKKAAKIAKEKYPRIHFVWVKVPKMLQHLDKVAFWLVRNFFKKEKAISFRSVFTLFWYIRFSSKFLKKEMFDKVILENNIPIANIIKKSSYQGQYYYHLHNTPRINAHCKDIFDQCSGYLCVSEYVGKEIEKNRSAIGPVPKKKVKILYNCIDIGLFKPMKNTDRNTVRQKICDKYHIPRNQHLVIFAGRLSKEKGPDQLLKAVMNMKDVTVLIVGGLLSGLNLNDSYQEEIHTLAKGLGNRAVFTGYIDQEILPLYYGAADLAVFPSMWDEPAGLTMIEAMACGTPIITTRSGGIPEYVGNIACVLDRNKNLPENITKAMKRYFNLNKEKKERIRQDGIKRIQDNFSREKYLERFIESIKK